MKSFAYHAPDSLSEAFEILSAEQAQARLLAGGTDLLVQMRRGLRPCDHIIDVKGIPELNQLSYSNSEGLLIGAAVSCAEICELKDIKDHYPALSDAVSLIGSTAIQGRATLGGNLCNAAPSADTIPAMIVLNASCTIGGSKERRTVGVEEFCTGPGETVLDGSEILLSVHVPPPQPRSGGSYMRFIPRGEMDIAVAGVGAWVKLKGESIAAARIALGAVAPKPLFVREAGEALTGAVANEESFERAAVIAQAATSPISDARGTEAQRRHIVGVLLKRTLREAVERAQGKGGSA